MYDERVVDVMQYKEINTSKKHEGWKIDKFIINTTKRWHFNEVQLAFINLSNSLWSLVRNKIRKLVKN